MRGRDSAGEPEDSVAGSIRVSGSFGSGRNGEAPVPLWVGSEGAMRVGLGLLVVTEAVGVDPVSHAGR